MSHAETPALAALADALLAPLDLYRLDSSTGPDLRRAARELADAVGRLRRQDRAHPELPRLRDLAHSVWSAGYLSQAVPADDLAAADLLRERDWPGILGAMLFVPCWQWDAAPGLDGVPDWLWPDFIDWVFVPPCLATAPGAADAYLTRVEALAATLDKWAGRNLGAPCVRAAVDAFERQRSTPVPLRSTGGLKRWESLCASLLGRLRRRAAPAAAARPRAGRRLRVGILAKDWGESIATRTWLPRLSALDPDRFELHLFADLRRFDALERHCLTLASKLHVLPQGLEERADVVLGAAPDVLVHAGTLGTPPERDLALRRLAPLQAVTDACPGASGFPAIDLHLTGAGSASSEFSESLGLLPGTGFSWDGAAAAPAPEAATRESLGLPARGPVMACAAHPEHLSPEALRAWVALLHANPSSSLLLILPPDSDLFTLEQSLARLRSASGLEAGRIVLSLGDPREALPLADVYLDTYPFSSPLGLLAALAAGLPAVAWEGASHRSLLGARILRGLGELEWVAADLTGYVTRAQRLLDDASLRASVRARLAREAAGERGLADAPLASEGFGRLLARAFDLVEEGADLPAIVSVPLPGCTPAELDSLATDAAERGDFAASLELAGARLLGEPGSTEARSALGRAHLQSGHAAAAVVCFGSALRGHEGDAQLWLDLGSGLRAKKDIPGAIKAYEKALRLDGTRIDGWIALSELARACGVAALADDAIGVARRLDPWDPRLVALDA